MSLSAINYGTSTGGSAGAAETTSTIGTDQQDVRDPPTVYHLWNEQNARLRQYIAAHSSDTKGGTRLLARYQSSSPFGAGERGWWVDDSFRPRFSNGTTAYTVPADSETTLTFSATPAFSALSFQRIVMTANITSWTFAAGYGGQVATISFIQDGTGSRTLAGTPGNVKLAGGSLTLTTTASKRDLITFRYDATSAIWYEQARSLNL